jgi:hypothetical protein
MAKAKKTGTDDLPGMTGKGVVGVVIPSLTKAINSYERKKEARCQVSPAEVSAKREVLALLHKHRDELPVTPEGQRFYRHDGVDYILEEVMKRRTADEADDGKGGGDVVNFGKPKEGDQS